jgi:hypothetical protein
MKTTRRRFLATAGAAGLASPLLSTPSHGAESAGGVRSPEAQARQAKLIEVLRQPVLRRELFTSPVIIQSVELLRWETSYNIHLVSVLSNAGAHHEFKGLDTQVRFECKSSPLKVVHGKIKVPTGPGLGVEIDPEFIQKHRPVTA